MANILFTWERGMGMGHLLPHLNLIREFQSRQHRVLFAVRNRATAETILKPLGCSMVQAPKPGRRLSCSDRNLPLSNLPQMLYNVGFHDHHETASAVRAWQHLYKSFKPDLLVSDFSPTALLAAHGSDLPRVAFGLGYLFPPDEEPMPPMCPWAGSDPAKPRAYHERLLGAVNRVAALTGLPRVDRLTVLTQGDRNLISSVQELDSHPGRSASFCYHYDPATFPGGVNPVWPEGPGKKIFGYLRPSTHLLPLLKALQLRGCPTLIHAPGISMKLQKFFTSSGLQFAPQPLNMKLVRETCNLAVMDATSGSIGQMLWGGKPMLLLTGNIDQRINGRKVWESGTGLVWPPFSPDDGKSLADCLERMLSEPAWTARAEALSVRIRNSDSTVDRTCLVETLEHLTKAAN
ncbi:MAG: hypothetical protein KJ950_01540 [Proteobacteria bacterium]|nr:hypothetical protein [Pseudomonadota bacterium]MBU1685725.1 hypothetical protein [Pseudomonadota bacterium]